jgi:hypothetical protein
MPLRTNKTKRAVEIIGFTLGTILLWICSAFVLWWAYDFGPLCKGGAFERTTAIRWVEEFGALIALALVGVWAIQWKRLTRSKIRTAWAICWQSAALLSVYAALIILRRETWSLSKGANDWAMFFGSLNARFFSEVGPLIFVLMVVPILSVLSALLFSLQRSVNAANSPEGS